MRIAGATILEYSRKLDGRSWNPVSRWTERRAPLLMLHADNGLVGIGEAWARQDEIGRVLDLLAEEVSPALVGARIDSAGDIPRITGAYRGQIGRGGGWPLAAAISATDIALWDLWSRVNEQPLWKALGGASDSVAVYASGGLYRAGSGLADLEAETKMNVGAGFRAVKIKVGGMPLADDIERVRAVRRALGSEGALWVDAVNQLEPSAAVESSSALRSAGATAIQAPVAFDDVATMARINATALPVVAGEAEHRLAGFDALIEAGAVTFVQFNLALCGGFSGARCVAEVAATGDVALSVQCHGTAVLQAASLHIGAAYRGVHSVEFHRFHDHLHCLLPPAMRCIDAGTLRLGDEPGLGIAPLSVGVQDDGGTIRRHACVGTTAVELSK